MSSRILGIFLALALVFGAVPARAANASPSPNPKDEIIYRASLGSADDIRLLLKQGASPNQKNDKGVPVLALAGARIDKGAIDVAKALLTAGADINGTDADGQTALFYAAKTGNLAMVNFLLDRGIKYYAEDKEGTIARTVAFQEGHTDIVKAMDSFVNAQTKKVEEDYKKANAILAERYKQQQEAMIKLRQQEMAAAKPAPQPKPTPKPIDKAAEARKAENIKDLAKGLSYHACQFQYWYFVNAVKQETKFSSEDLDIAIDAHKKQVEGIEKTLMENYGETSHFVVNVANSAKKRIFNQLTSLQSNSYRRIKGVGTTDDAEARCQSISRDWSIDPSSVPDAKPGILGGE